MNRDIATDQEKLKELEMSSEQFQQQLNGIMNDMEFADGGVGEGGEGDAGGDWST